MPRVIVITDDQPDLDSARVLLDERVQSAHLSQDHSAAQFVERVGWAISDAEEAARQASGLSGHFEVRRPARRGASAEAGFQPRPSRVAALLARRAA